MNTRRVDQWEIFRDLRDVGVLPGMLLIAHTSLSSIGQVNGGANTVLEALLQAVTEKGTLVIPTFTWGYLSTYDQRTTSCVIGAIPETARRRADFTRSFHPTHSVAAKGPLARAITENHGPAGALAKGSPFHRAAQWGGQVLMLGCDHRSNSMVHVGEDLFGVPYRARTPERHTYGISSDGRETVFNVAGTPQCSIAFGAIEAPLREAGGIRDGRIASARSQLMSGQAILDATFTLLRDKPDVLLCTDPTCFGCKESREKLRTAPFREA
ncbi:MAG: AAC(3) family N-acetyltransferase [Planctomycetota bacterium]